MAKKKVKTNFGEIEKLHKNEFLKQNADEINELNSLAKKGWNGLGEFPDFDSNKELAGREK